MKFLPSCRDATVLISVKKTFFRDGVNTRRLSFSPYKGCIHDVSFKLALIVEVSCWEVLSLQEFTADIWRWSAVSRKKYAQYKLSREN